MVFSIRFHLWFFLIYTFNHFSVLAPLDIQPMKCLLSHRVKLSNGVNVFPMSLYSSGLIQSPTLRVGGFH